eukprot:28085_1
MTTVTDSSVLKIGSIIGFKPPCTQNNPNTNTHNTITIGIIVDNININNCDIRDIHDDKLYKNVPWRSIYVLYSLEDDKQLFNKGDQCYAVWKEQKVIKKNKIEYTYTTQYYQAIFMHKDLRKNEIQLKYRYGADGNIFTLPTYVTIYDFEYPTLVKPIIAAYSEAYRKLKLTFSSSISEDSKIEESKSGECTESNNFDNASQLQAVNNHELSKPAKIVQTKKKRQRLKVSKILKRTRQKARRRVSNDKPTQISASTKLIFVLAHKERGNASKILREMKNDGYIVGKRPRTSEWIGHGPQYFKKLIAEKGDVYKFSLWLFVFGVALTRLLLLDILSDSISWFQHMRLVLHTYN